MTRPTQIGREGLVVLLALATLGAVRGSASAESLRGAIPMLVVEATVDDRLDSPDAPTASGDPLSLILADTASLRLPSGDAGESAAVKIGPAPRMAEPRNLFAWLRFLRPDEEVSDSDPLSSLPRTDDLWRSPSRQMSVPTAPAEDRPLVRRPRFAQVRR